MKNEQQTLLLESRPPVHQLPVRRLSDITAEDGARTWLIRWLWTLAGVGLIGRSENGLAALAVACLTVIKGF